MDQWLKIGTRARNGASIREIQRETGLHFNTIKKDSDVSVPSCFSLPGPRMVKIFSLLPNALLAGAFYRETT